MIKNFLFLLRRFKTSSILNVFGLSVAFAIFSVVMFQFLYDYGYDRQFEKSDDLYVFAFYYPPADATYSIVSRPEAEDIAAAFPEIKSYGLMTFNEHLPLDRHLEDGTIVPYMERLTRATPGILDIFSMNILAGDAHKALTEPGHIMLSESTAIKIFGTADVVGEPIYYHYYPEPLIIAAVCGDVPDNCSLINGAYGPMVDNFRSDFRYFGFFEIPGGQEVANSIADRINEENMLFTKESGEFFIEHPEEKFTASFIPIKKKEHTFMTQHAANMGIAFSLLAIGVICLLVAFINFINFSVAMAPLRVRSLNIQKILGANPRTLQFRIAGEAMLFSFIAFLLSLLFIMLLKTTPVAEFLVADLSLSGNIPTLVCIGLGLLLVSFLFGLYPARYITSFQPAVALSGSFAASGRSSKLRNVLIVFQFVTAITLIILSGFIKLQHDYLVNFTTGFEKENIVCMSSWRMQAGNQGKTFGEELKKHPEIIDYTMTISLPGEVGSGWTSVMEGQPINFAGWVVESNFLDFMGVPIVQGSNFTEQADSMLDQYIFNEKFLAEYNLQEVTGKELSEPSSNRKGVIRGIAVDINYLRLDHPLRPMAFVYGDVPFNGQNSWREAAWIMVKISDKNIPKTLDIIEQEWKKFSSEPFEVTFLDERMNQLYKDQNDVAKLLSIFGLIIVIIAIMGVYGLIVFNAAFRAKEIAIRKVNGSSIKEIMLMLNRTVLIQFAIAFTISVPMSYYLVRAWFEGFAYKTPLHWWVFLLAGLLVFVITLVTVSAQSYKAATANPTKSLNKE